MIGAVLSWAAYTVFAKRLADADQTVTIAVVSVFGTLMIVPLAAVELAHTPWRAPSMQAWAGVIFLGVIASALAGMWLASTEPAAVIESPSRAR